MKKIIFTLFVLWAEHVLASSGKWQWGYGKTVPGKVPVYGPADWGQVYRECGKGQAQSPVDIATGSVIQKKIGWNGANELRITFNDNRGRTKGTLSNNGHSPTFAVKEGGASLVNPINGQTYKLAQFHFHFGCEDNVGSEHTVDGQAFPGEVHFVFYNSDFDSFETAASTPNGLTVVGAFLEKTEYPNKELRILTWKKLKPITKEGSATEDVSLNLKFLIPTPDRTKPLKYYSYQGSLTTPDCSQTVSWIILDKKIGVDTLGLGVLRSLRATHGKYKGTMCDNYRPTQPLNKRKVTFYTKKTQSYR